MHRSIILILTCFFHDGGELLAGHSKDDENDQWPGDQSQGPDLKRNAGQNFQNKILFQENFIFPSFLGNGK